eukprot:SM000166S02467  [mRNA]  locus=s166:161533:170771:+ [translate_table: standard]
MENGGGDRLPTFGGGGGGGGGASSSGLDAKLRSGRNSSLIQHPAYGEFGGHRTVCVNDRTASELNHKSNSVSTTKYTAFTFLPKGLFEQFRRVANFYFLLIAILSTTPISPVHPITNVGPLVLVLAVSLMKEAFEDRKRYNSDKVINASPTESLSGRDWVSVPWSAVKVGDIVRVKCDQFFPADLLCLASTNADGICYIETSNLDGETNLKIRKALERTWEYVTSEAAAEFKGTVECEQPNNSLYTFTGNLVTGKQTLPVTPNQILLRGCSLRNTEWIVGCVIFTGHETKVMMNAMDVPSKRSTLERRLDKLILILFLILFVICFIGGIGSAIFLDRKYWYLHLDDVKEAQYDPSNRFVVAILNFFTFLTLYSTIIPISLYVSIEMIKIVQSTQFINKDLNMYYRETDTPALARTSNLNEELGQIEYIFSDKTGTLTQNMMEFFKCSIGGVMYGTGVTEIQRASAKRTGIALDEYERSEEAVYEKGFNFDDKRLMRGAWRNEPVAEICKEFFRLLAICHTVLPEGEETTDKIEYQAASPDEAALVAAAKNFGFFFYRRTPTTIRVRESHVEKLGRIMESEYEILNVLEFNSNRKRQSVICRFPNGRLVLYCKGADSMIFERLSEKGSKYKESTRQHLEKFGSDGLRTLCLACRDLDPAFYEEWNEKFVLAKSSLRERERKLDEVAEEVEKELVLLGCTAIEDKLQDGVPACIETISSAGIKIWVLTGDKMETAINIAYACSLLTNEMKQFIISSEADVIREAEGKKNALEVSRTIREYVVKQLQDAMRQALSNELDGDGFDIALVIDGRCLMYALEPALRGDLVGIGTRCKAVVCCRVSPLQKAQVTTLMKEGAGKITLSIGDGANDVSMIQAAHIGVGISGQEGMQAVLASDFAIAQFRYLTDLLLVHGRLAYMRLSKVVVYFFYKNLAFTLTSFWFNCYAGYSGQRLYDDWFQSLFNVAFTALPDVDPATSKIYPQLYKAGIRNMYFNWWVITLWLIAAIYQSIIFFFLPLGAGVSPQNNGAQSLGLWEIGTMVYTVVIISVNLRLFMAVSFFNKWHFYSVLGSIGLWFVVVLIYDALSPSWSSIESQGNQYWVIYNLLGTAYFWLMVLFAPFVALMFDLLYQGLQRWLKPHDYQIIQENLKFHGGLDIPPSGHLEMQSLTDDEPVVRPSVEEQRRRAMAALPTLASKKHTGFSFDSPGFDSFFAMQEGVSSPARSWDVARRASMTRRRSQAASPEFIPFPRVPERPRSLQPGTSDALPTSTSPSSSSFPAQPSRHFRQPVHGGLAFDSAFSQQPIGDPFSVSSSRGPHRGELALGATPPILEAPPPLRQTQRREPPDPFSDISLI